MFLSLQSKILKQGQVLAELLMELNASNSGLQVIAYTNAAVEFLRYKSLDGVTQPTIRTHTDTCLA